MDNKRILSDELRGRIDKAFKKCYSCGRCTSGCPVAQEMDYPPSMIVKWLALGEEEKILRSDTIWTCSSCQTCLSRCPFEIDIPGIIDLLKSEAVSRKLAKKERSTRIFHKIFLNNVKRFGRVHETSLIGEWKAFSGKWFNDLFLGLRMFTKGKLSMLPETVKDRREIKRLFELSQKKGK